VAGTIDILAALKYLQFIGQASATATIGHVDFGWEVHDTAGQSLAFKVTGYSINTS